MIFFTVSFSRFAPSRIEFDAFLKETDTRTLQDPSEIFWVRAPGSAARNESLDPKTNFSGRLCPNICIGVIRADVQRHKLSVRLLKPGETRMRARTKVAGMRRRNLEPEKLPLQYKKAREFSRSCANALHQVWGLDSGILSENHCQSNFSAGAWPFASRPIKTS